MIRLLMDEEKFTKLVKGEIVEWQHEGKTIQLILSDIGVSVMRKHIDAVPTARDDAGHAYTK